MILVVLLGLPMAAAVLVEGRLPAASAKPDVFAFSLTTRPVTTQPAETAPSGPWQKGTGSEPSTRGAIKKSLPRGACPLLPRAASAEAGEQPTTSRSAQANCVELIAKARPIAVDRCAPVLSRRCYQTTGPDAELAALAGEALTLLDQAAQMLEDAEAQSPDRTADPAVSVPPAERRELSDRIDLLRAFAEMFAALAEDPGAEQAKGDLIAACSRLAMYLDDENEKIAASARLWMGVAYRLAGRPERALQLFRPVLSPLDAPRIELIARLQRCLVLSERGEHAAALAVGLRIGGRVGTGFADEDSATRRQAEGAVRYVLVEVWRDWSKRLRADGDARSADNADRQAAELLGGETWPPPTDRRLSLTASIAGLEDWQ